MLAALLLTVLSATPDGGPPMTAPAPQPVAAGRMPGHMDKTAPSRAMHSTSYKIMMPGGDTPMPKAAARKAAQTKP